MVSEIENWEEGCRTDLVRNNFLIPELISFLEEYQSETILDVGTGTGYIARQVDQKLSYRPYWTAIDLLAGRISYAIENKPASMQMIALEKSFQDVVSSGTQFEAIFLIFTLLEMELTSQLCCNLNKLLYQEGLIFVVMPNSFEDVLISAKKTPDIIANFLQNKCELEKIDKFTQQKYPFKAHRFEYIIECMLCSSHNLVHMKSKVFEGRETFLLIFQKAGEVN